MTAQANITDLKNWHQSGLPVWTGWNKGGFTLKWYNDLVRTGCRVIPPINLLPYDYPEDVTRGSGAAGSFAYFLGSQSAELEWIGHQGIPITLRFGNIASSFYSPRYRSKPLQDSPLTWETVNSVQRATTAADYLGPVTNWDNEGRLVGGSPYVAEIAKRIPNPSSIIHMENHEAGWGPGPNAGGFTIPLSDKPTAWTDDKPALGIAPDLKFKTAAEIARWSVRLAQRVLSGEAVIPWAEFASACRKIKALYDAYYDGLFSAFPQTWKASQFLTGAYSSGRVRDWQFPKVVTDVFGPAPDASYVNGSGSEFYVDGRTKYQTTDFTSPDLDKFTRQQRPAWEWEEAHDPDSFRMIFVALNGEGAIDGRTNKHPPITPEVWGACCAWLAWNNRGANKRPVMLVHYTDNKVKPTDLFFNAAQQAELVAMGRPEMCSLTEGDYAASGAKALNFLDNPVIRKFWTDGTPLPVTYSAGPVNIWRAETMLGDDRMIYEWSSRTPWAGSRYSFVRGGKFYDLDEYTALVTKTPFELLAEANPELTDPKLPAIDKDFGDKVLRIINAVRP